MANVPVQFLLAGEVESWNSTTRKLQIGGRRLNVDPDVAVEALVPKQGVTVIGHWYEFGPWVVTKIQAHRPTF